MLVVPCHLQIRHLARYEHPFFSNMSHCANATWSTFEASAGRQIVTSTGSGSTDSISVNHSSTGRRIPEGKAATQIEPHDRRGIDWITQMFQISQAIGRRFRGILQDWKAQRDYVGQFQTRLESCRISGLKVTQTSPQIPRQNLLAKESYLKVCQNP